jgi:hypothetical protein
VDFRPLAERSHLGRSGWTVNGDCVIRHLSRDIRPLQDDVLVSDVAQEGLIGSVRNVS